MNEQAAHWAARALDGEIPAAMAGDFGAWMAADRRHRGAYLRARAALYAIEDTVLEHRDAARGDRRPAIVAVARKEDDAPVDASRPLGRGWSQRIMVGGTLAASLALAVGLGVPALSPTRVPPRPAVGRALTLADGSVATLGDGARIDFAMRDGVRKVVLLQGEATFDVAKDRQHPFVVQSGDVYAQATGTHYSVRRVGAAGGAVRVKEGSVLVWGRDERDQAVVLRAGDALTLEPGTGHPDRTEAARPASPPPPPPPPPELAQISLDNVTIEAAARRFNRINRAQIVIADPAVGQVRIVGLFRANDPERFAEAAAAVAGAIVEVRGDRIEVKMK
ncbi:hypothetical protein TS85_05815 [Sphingomonas hengshuiensis]|uniref:FecR protein domain-containing protein n=2 Tax=Sphingomonas hengshuiensis TaxID=1609977 RepID=A0A7U4J763_9SPHN|nr:hypothetical protein TS85_05815 [Sphingomonas hengshuiensis]